MPLSKRATALLKRVSTPSRYYRTFGTKTPKAMQELLDAGLVRKGVRNIVVGSFYVPIGFEEPGPEKFPTETPTE